MTGFYIQQADRTGFMLRAAQRTGIDDAAAANNFIPAAMRVAVKDVIVVCFNKGFDVARDVAVGGSDADAGDEFAAKKAAGYIAGIEAKQGLADSYGVAVHVALDVDNGEACEVHGRSRRSHVAAMNQCLDSLAAKEGQRPLQVGYIIMCVRKNTDFHSLTW